MNSQVLNRKKDYPVMAVDRMSDTAFSGFQKLIYTMAGITMPSTKRSLIASRLNKRLVVLGLADYDEYYNYITRGNGANNGELQKFIDSLTTNETYFYRESQHFEYLRERIIPEYRSGKRLRIWSAASSSGEEAYTLAMVLADELGVNGNWEILGTDISSRMIEAARKAVYVEQRVRQVSLKDRHRYLLKGTGSQQGYVAIVPELRRQVKFEHYNLIESPYKSERFDVIFCRNVLIYFNNETKQRVIKRLCHHLKDNCHIITGHSESLHGMSDKLQSIMPSIYKKTGG